MDDKEDTLGMRILTAVLVAFQMLALCAAAVASQEPDEVEVRPALLVIDVQNAWLPMMAEEDKETATDRINEAIALFRENGYPVIRVYHSDPKHGPELDSEKFQFPESIAVTDDDAMIVKAHASSFVRTKLEEVLRDKERNTVFLCGLSATGCVLATYFGALERDFTTLMVKDALISPDASHTKVIEDICYSMTLEEISRTFANKQK
jgi:nicotinamidase-related amidase